MQTKPKKQCIIKTVIIVRKEKNTRQNPKNIDFVNDEDQKQGGNEIGY